MRRKSVHAGQPITPTTPAQPGAASAPASPTNLEITPMQLRYRLAFLGTLVCATTPLPAATFTVTTNADSGPGSFREAISLVNATSGTHTINFSLAPTTVITITSDLPFIQRDSVIINGAAVPGLVISGGGSAPLLRIGSNNRSLAVRNLIFQDGLGPEAGGCLAAMAPVAANAGIVLNDVEFRRCATTAHSGRSHGAAMFVYDRNVTLGNVRFEDSRTLPAGAQAANDTRGGALHVEAFSVRQLTIDNSRFTGNRATAADGRIARGGAIHISGPYNTLIDRSRFVDNHASGTIDSRGGAIHTEAAGRLVIENSLFHANVADGQGTVYAQSVSGELHVRNSTFVGNIGGAAVVGQHPMIAIRNNSFADNNPMIPGGAQQLSLTGTAATGATPITISNNLMIPLLGNTDLQCATLGAITLVAGHNIVAGHMQGCGPENTTPLNALRIEALRADGGTVESLTLRAGGAALDAGNPVPPSVPDLAACMTVDARGVSRPKDGDADGSARCDAGAWESDGEAPLFRDDYEPVLWRPAS
ncbi:hypothetical protein B1808_12500 [Pseudofulvimonas gallinarii]|jgi:hypothetical protein|nr:right-handed parallel beta-helix repeat-containing protein [Pseudofulvimonas gallinarii]THD12548.1 hypothetical protein B1808_12500 [Pseudofulvimonas gallinarii]